jgi:hypothetical protein
MENAGEEVVAVLGLLVVVGQCVVVLIIVVLWRCQRMLCSSTRRRCPVKWEVHVVEEARLPPRIVLGQARAVLGI